MAAITRRHVARVLGYNSLSITRYLSTVRAGESPADRIYLRGLVFFGYHGVLPHETENGQQFVVDAVLHTDLRRAGETDDLTQTVNYADVYSTIKEVVQGPPNQLIETVAEQSAAAVLKANKRIDAIDICVKKPQAPIDGMFDHVGEALKCIGDEEPA